MLQQIFRGPLAGRTRACLLICSALGLGACGGGGAGSSDAFVIRTSDFATASTTPPVVQGDWMVFFADEATSAASDLNGDNDVIDAVAVVVRFSKNQSFELGVAANSAAIVGDEIYLEVDENADQRDWNVDGFADDSVLLHWSLTTNVLVYVDDLHTAGLVAIVSSSARLYYRSEAALVGPEDTALYYLDQSAPTTPVLVQNVLGEGQLLPNLLGEDAGLLFVSMNESDLGVDLNGDLDPSDPYVLGLLDTTDPAATLKSTGLGLESLASPFDAHALNAGGDWLVAVLVYESAQAADLNDPAPFAGSWVAENCSAVADGDQSDTVLHYIEYGDWFAGLADPVNTGLAGRDRVLALEGFVATLSPEDDANCDLNNDGDTLDLIPRWVEALAPLLPPGDSADMLAVADVPGGSHGLSRLGSRLVAVISEENDERDHDGQVGEHDLVAWLDPSVGSIFDFTHDSGVSGVPQVGADWMAPEELQGRLGIAFQELLSGESLNTNLNCNPPVAKDADLTDGLPTWARFSGAPAALGFPGLGYALATNNAGLVQAAGYAFFRVSEANDNIDFNSDGDKADNILFRNPLLSCNPVPMATASGNAVSVIFTDGVEGAAFFSSESQAGVDFNLDGDMNDLSLRWFRF